MMQLTLSFKPGLTQEFKSLRAVTQTTAIKTQGGIAGLAPAVDMSPSQLGRKLQGEESDPHRTFDINDFELLLDEMHKRKLELTPLHYLIEKYNISDEQRRFAAIEKLADAVGHATTVLAEFRSEAPVKARRR